MAKPQLDYTLYLVTDRDLMSADSLEQAVDRACAGGATLVQLREKHAGHDELLELAGRVKQVTDAHGVGLIVNDDARVAAEVRAAGVHVGQGDMPLPEVRAIVGDDAVIGVSASNLAQALAAQQGGADYLGIGAMTYTPTKPDAQVTSRDELGRILDAVDIPCVVIGGIGEASIPSYASFAKLAGYAVVSAIMAADDIAAAASRLHKLIGR